MDDEQLIAVSARHSVLLLKEYVALVEKAPRSDIVVSTIAKREAGNLPLMAADLVIAGEDTRASFPLAATYPLHFRKTYFPGRMHGEPMVEFARQARASELTSCSMPIGYSASVFRACLVPGRPFSRLSPFGTEPETSNIATAAKLPLASAAGLWRLAEDTFAQLTAIHEGGLAHGDAELHNFIVSPSPLELVPIDFEAAVLREDLDDAAWAARRDADLLPVLREAVFLQCALGRQRGPLADASLERMDAMFANPARFRATIERQAGLT
jgi:hypothetical protein